MRTKFLISLFFTLFLIIGIFVYKDYGVSWDEPIQRAYGIDVLEFVKTGAGPLTKNKERYYGPFFEFVLISAEKITNLTNMGQIYQQRHLLTFLSFWLGCIFFFKLLKLQFSSLNLAFLGTLMLIVSPRIFAHSFYNSKDIPLLAFFIIASFYNLKFIKDKGVAYAIFGGLVSGLASDIRIVGVILPIITLILVPKNNLKVVGIYLFVYLTSVYLFWPTLWESPIRNFMASIEQISKYPQSTGFLFFGQQVVSTSVPWYYTLGWVLVTTPLFYTALFVVGLGGKLDKVKLYYLMWFFIPLFSTIFLKSTLYDGWRQMFFIYPAFVVLACYGIKRWPLGKVLVLVSVLVTAVTMFRFHPFQNSLFNLPITYTTNISKSFILDYWGLSYKQLYEKLDDLDNRDEIFVYVDTLPGETNMAISKNSNKFKLVRSIEEADYYLTNYRTNVDISMFPEVYTIVVHNYKIAGIYKVR